MCTPPRPAGGIRPGRAAGAGIGSVGDGTSQLTDYPAGRVRRRTVGPGGDIAPCRPAGGTGRGPVRPRPVLLSQVPLLRLLQHYTPDRGPDGEFRRPHPVGSGGMEPTDRADRAAADRVLRRRNAVAAAACPDEAADSRTATTIPLAERPRIHRRGQPGDGDP